MTDRVCTFCGARVGDGDHFCAPKTSSGAARSGVVGLDLSLASPGVADENGARALKVPAKLRGPERLIWIRTQLRDVYECAQLVMIEDYAYGAKGQAVTGLAELGGVIRTDLYELLVPFAVVTSTGLKKYAAGKGNASKDQVLVAAVKRGADVDSNDAADAWWLRAMALDHLGAPVAQMPALNRAALEAIEWPKEAEIA